MAELDFRRPFPFINSSIFSPYNVPFQLDETEVIHYFNPKTHFTLIIGTGAPALTTRYMSKQGAIFLTNKRLLYRPNTRTVHFESFSLSLRDIIHVDKDNSILIKITSEYASEIFIAFEDTHSKIFYNVVVGLVGSEVSYDSRVIAAEEEILPLYCEVIKEENNPRYENISE